MASLFFLNLLFINSFVDIAGFVRFFRLRFSTSPQPPKLRRWPSATAPPLADIQAAAIAREHMNSLVQEVLALCHVP